MTLIYWDYMIKKYIVIWSHVFLFSKSTVVNQNMYPFLLVPYMQLSLQEKIQLETARLYKLAGINPLAGT